MQFHKLSKFQFHFDRRFLVSLALFGIIVLMSVGDAQAQRRKSVFGNESESKKEKNSSASPKSSKANPTNSTRPGNLAATPGQKTKKDDEFAPQVVTLDVKKESIQLVATWFPPRLDDKKKKKKKSNPNPAKKSDEEEVDPGKETSPFILVHDWGRGRNDLLAMASFLQAQGHAVIVPDLRGHGESLRMRGTSETLDQTKFKKSEIASAVRDIDQCKRFLQEKNNEGIINIDLLNVVAVGDSSHLAIAWAMSDWTWEPVAGIKQGKDVKSLILFSPTKKFAGSSLKKLAKDPFISGRNSTPLPLFVVWGGRSDAAKECGEFIDTLRKFRPEAPQEDDMATRWFKQNLFHYEAQTNMQGFELAGSPRAKEAWTVANNFVSQKVLNFKDQFPWQIRGAEAVLKAREAQK